MLKIYHFSKKRGWYIFFMGKSMIFYRKYYLLIKKYRNDNREKVYYLYRSQGLYL